VDDVDSTTNERAAKRTAFISGLQELAGFLAEHPEVPIPYYTTLNVFVGEKADIARAAKAGSWDKIFNGEWFYLRRTFQGCIDFDVTVERDVVCRKVVTGTKLVPAQPERSVDEYEWVCDEPLLAMTRTP
jgi:hypothetical protein